MRSPAVSGSHPIEAEPCRRVRQEGLESELAAPIRVSVLSKRGRARCEPASRGAGSARRSRVVLERLLATKRRHPAEQATEHDQARVEQVHQTGQPEASQLPTCSTARASAVGGTGSGRHDHLVRCPRPLDPAGLRGAAARARRPPSPSSRWTRSGTSCPPGSPACGRPRQRSRPCRSTARHRQSGRRPRPLRQTRYRTLSVPSAPPRRSSANAPRSASLATKTARPASGAGPAALLAERPANRGSGPSTPGRR